ncbi:MAG: tetratricopeptide repeat protein [Spirochaetales bacterium]
MTIKKIIFSFSLFICICANVYAQTALDLYTQGQGAQSKEDWYAATEFYMEALDKNPAYGEAWFSLAQCAYELDQYDLAILYADNAYKYIKNRTDIPNLKGFALIGLGNLTEAGNVFLQVLQEQPNDIDARFGLAQLDIFYGKLTSAEMYYIDALKRESSDKKALVSLALIADELGDTQKAFSYIQQALRYHNDRADVYYFAAYLAAKQNDTMQAETYIRNAIRLNGNYEEAYALLADILFAGERYREAIDICDYLIAQNRNTSSAWYIKGLSQIALNNIEDALNTLQTGLYIDPQNEIMRAAFELLVYEKTAVEDNRRTQWAAYHLDKAKIAQEKYLSNQALYEYRRTLRIDPLNVEARLAFADVLLQQGYTESYLSQLEFLQSQGLSTQAVNDLVESYSSVLANTLPLRWGIDPFYLDKTRWTIGLYHFEESLSLYHQNALTITANMLADIFNSEQSVALIANSGAVASYARAFNNAREQGYDFFALLDVSEGDRDIKITMNLYVSTSGNRVASWEVYRTGNDRFAAALQTLKNDITITLPRKGLIIDRRGSNVLIDMGKKEGVTVGSVFNVYAKDSLKPADTEIGLKYDETQSLGSITVNAVGEDVSQGIFTQKGFYDLVNIGDEIIPAVALQTEEIIQDSSVPVETTAGGIEAQTSALYKLIESIRN